MCTNLLLRTTYFMHCTTLKCRALSTIACRKQPPQLYQS
jgi:hypothetical protein